MTHLNAYEVPENIKEIERDGDYHNDSFRMYADLVPQSRSKEEVYLTTYGAMVHFEEAANFKIGLEFDLQNVNIQMHSHADRIFKIKNDVSTIGSDLRKIVSHKSSFSLNYSQM